MQTLKLLQYNITIVKIKINLIGRYQIYYNKVLVAPGAKQPPLFKATYPDYTNYGAIGTWIGSEVAQVISPRGQHTL